MGKPDRADALLAVAEATALGPAGGNDVLELLSRRGVAVRADQLMTQLLGLEVAGLIHVDRAVGWRCGLTGAGERAVSEIGGGAVVERTLLMVDLVGFVEVTDRHGDAAARDAASALLAAGSRSLGQASGRILKSTGDGFLAAAPLGADLAAAARQVAGSVRDPAGEVWPLRAAVHDGRPIEHRGDLFGRDVNLLARMCEAAHPGELVRTVPSDFPGAEALQVRGLDQAVPVERVLL